MKKTSTYFPIRLSACYHVEKQRFTGLLMGGVNGC